MIEAFFAALRNGDRNQAQRYLGAFKVRSEELEELAMKGAAVSVTVQPSNSSLFTVQLRSDQPLQYWPLCPFAVALDGAGERIDEILSCPAPLPPSPETPP